ncbi:MAG: histidinol-phosphate transaminase [candidate division WOR-3 bacterium]|uniref:Histidinol-phosphate aminotransferase n=1 Tax=candidate division WOR-3 bacterium TaxID=2052148 RepID=A0A7C1SDB8_UNCW3|nr:histidinol-phosphate transaminase [candidate division WOR-3 bacterium]
MALPLPRPNLERVVPYKPGKPVEEVVRELKLKGPVIKLASNENPLGPSPKALAALRKALPQLHYYPEDTCYYLRQHLSELYRVDYDSIIVGNGSVDLIYLACLAYLDPGDEMIISAGSFISARIAGTIMNANIIQIPTREYRHDLERILASITPKTKLIYLDNPINPLGTIVNRKELAEFMAQLPEHVLVVLDEAYAEYITSRDYPRGLDFYNQNYNILVLRTFSKIYGLAGLRIGYGFARPEIIQTLMKVRLPFNANRAAQVAAIAALSDTRHVKRSRQVNEAGKAMFYREFKRLKLFYLESYANFVFVNFTVDSSLIFDILQRKGVITRTVKEYGFPTALRVSVGREPENRRFLKALNETLAYLRISTPAAD